VIEHPTINRRTGVATAIGVLSAVFAATFFFGALLHLGVKVPLGFTVLEEPRILPATMVECLCGLALAVAAICLPLSSRESSLSINSNRPSSALVRRSMRMKK